MAEHDQYQYIEVKHNDRTVASAQVTTQRGPGGSPGRRSAPSPGTSRPAPREPGRRGARPPRGTAERTPEGGVPARRHRVAAPAAGPLRGHLDPASRVERDPGSDSQHSARGTGRGATAARGSVRATECGRCPSRPAPDAPVGTSIGTSGGATTTGSRSSTRPACPPGPAGPVRGDVPDRRAQQQLLPLAPARRLRAGGGGSGRLPAVGQGPRGLTHGKQAVCARGLDGAHRGRLA